MLPLFCSFGQRFAAFNTLKHTVKDSTTQSPLQQQQQNCVFVHKEEKGPSYQTLLKRDQVQTY